MASLGSPSLFFHQPQPPCRWVSLAWKDLAHLGGRASVPFNNSSSSFAQCVCPVPNLTAPFFSNLPSPSASFALLLLHLCIRGSNKYQGNRPVAQVALFMELSEREQKCAHVHVCACVCVFAYTGMRLSICVFMHVLCVCVLCVCVHVFLHLCMCVCACKHVLACVCAGMGRSPEGCSLQGL